MAGVNLFDNFEEEHMETPSLPRYNTISRAHQHSDNKAQHLTRLVSHPITFTNTQVFHAAPKQAINDIPMANDVINQDTVASLEYCQLIQDENTFPVWNKSAANEFGCLTQGMRVEGSNTIFFIPFQAIPKGKIVTYGRFVVDIRPNKTEIHRVRLAVGGATLSNIQAMCQHAHQTSLIKSVSGTTLFPLKVLSICVWMSITFTLVPQWTHLSTCASQSNSSLRQSLQNTTKSLWYQMAMCIFDDLH
jgi:hypothetical protein